jgi:tetratricopeptide (TPR) repeat protein
MTFEEILDQAIAMLQRRGRLTYGTLKRQFQLDDAALEDLKNELIEGQRLAVDERGNAVGLLANRPLFIVYLSQGYLLAGRWEEATQSAQCALELARAHRARGWEAHALHVLGDVAMHREPPDLERAEVHYHQALTLAEELGMHPLQAHCHLGLGTLYATTDQHAQARAALSAAIALYRGMEMQFWLPLAEAHWPR